MSCYRISRAFLWIIFVCGCVSAQESRCCEKIPDLTEGCRSTCEKLMSTSITGGDREVYNQRMMDIRNFCSKDLVPFWECMNQTMEDIRRAENWSGRACCRLAQSERCQQTCMTVSSKQELFYYCRHSDEFAVFACIDRQEKGDDCCNKSQSDNCRSACRSIFRSNLTPSRAAKSALLHSCKDTSPNTLTCVNNITKATTVANPHKLMHCCDKASDKKCRDTCQKTLRTKNVDQEIIDGLQEGGCGPPLLHDKVWQCFLKSDSATSIEVSPINRLGMDSAKLHCCYKAQSSTCKKLCLKTFFNEFTNLWDNFKTSCLSTVAEDSLIHCLDEVEEPCELGCGGLSYCTNFNNRPTELFRSCSVPADEAARYDVALWTQQGNISLPGLSKGILIKNISQCSPLTWKAIACTLQIKPCQKGSHANRICRDDCFELLSQCMDWRRMPETSAESLCSILSPADPRTPCISLKPFLEPSDNPYHSLTDQVTQPCKGGPCNASQVCTINRFRQHSRMHPSYSCALGCKLGEVSQYIVPPGSYVRIPVATGHKGCQQICQCSPLGLIEQCQPMPCFPLESCWILGKKIEHSTVYYRECKMCSCFAGEITCSKKQCEMTAPGMRDLSYTTLPCNCPAHFVPVCGRNGQTYPNKCLAKCANLNDADFEFGTCEAIDPCKNNPCNNEGEVCVPARKVCLSLMHSPCQQFQCISMRDNCKNFPDEPVCSTDRHQYNNICELVHEGKILDYHGPCLNGCNRTGLVCGIDGNTYSSECSAWARYIQVDYVGGCSAVGLIEDKAVQQCSDLVINCPPLARPDCLGITPPGACCPVCAGALRILYSKKQVDRALYALRGKPISNIDKNNQKINALTLSTILKALDRQVQVAECTIRGYLTVEVDIIVLVVPVGSQVSDLQLESCVREAEKLASLLHRFSPRMISELSLSTLIAATVVHEVVPDSASTVGLHVLAPALFLLLRWFS